MIVVGSIFRNAQRYAHNWISQLEGLRSVSGGEEVVGVAVEGDSDDRTYSVLYANRHKIGEVLKVEHGGPMYPSVIDPQRWRQLSVASNAVLAAANRRCGPHDKFVYVESDLMWEPSMMMGLLAHLDTYAAVAPMSMHGERFYDTFGHTKDGKAFASYPPYFPEFTPDKLALIDTAGSCFAVRGDVLPILEFSAIDCIRGVGRSLAAHGLTLTLDPTLAVFHP